MNKQVLQFIIEEQQRIVDKIEQLLPLCDDIEQLIKQ